MINNYLSNSNLNSNSNSNSIVNNLLKLIRLSVFSGTYKSKELHVKIAVYSLKFLKCIVYT